MGKAASGSQLLALYPSRFPKPFVKQLKLLVSHPFVRFAFMLLVCTMAMFAQDPGSQIGNAATTFFTGPLITGISYAVLVVGGLMVAFGGGMMMRTIGAACIGIFIITHPQMISNWIQTW